MAGVGDLLIESLKEVYTEIKSPAPFRTWALQRFVGNTYLMNKVKDYFLLQDAIDKQEETKDKENEKLDMDPIETDEEAASDGNPYNF
jgi:hypothetical protein